MPRHTYSIHCTSCSMNVRVFNPNHKLCSKCHRNSRIRRVVRYPHSWQSYTSRVGTILPVPETKTYTSRCNHCEKETSIEVTNDYTYSSLSNGNHVLLCVTCMDILKEIIDNHRIYCTSNRSLVSDLYTQAHMPKFMPIKYLSHMKDFVCSNHHFVSGNVFKVIMSRNDLGIDEDETHLIPIPCNINIDELELNLETSEISSSDEVRHYIEHVICDIIDVYSSSNGRIIANSDFYNYTIKNVSIYQFPTFLA